MPTREILGIQLYQGGCFGATASRGNQAQFFRTGTAADGQAVPRPGGSIRVFRVKKGLAWGGAWMHYLHWGRNGSFAWSLVFVPAGAGAGARRCLSFSINAAASFFAASSAPVVFLYFSQYCSLMAPSWLVCILTDLLAHATTLIYPEHALQSVFLALRNARLGAVSGNPAGRPKSTVSADADAANMLKK